MTREETAKRIKIMQHFVDGGEVESRRHVGRLSWGDDDDPYWDWFDMEYRIKETKDQFTDWSVLPPEYKWIARNRTGDAWAGTEPPRLSLATQYWRWGGTKHLISVDMLTVFKRGTCDWQDSLIERPEGV